MLTYVCLFYIGNILSLRIYDPEVQSGDNLCSVNKGNCSHLCLPVSATQRVCMCATGFRVHPQDHTKCIGELINIL
jgi:integrin beta 2